jgi:hypothetical protein
VIALLELGGETHHVIDWEAMATRQRAAALAVCVACAWGFSSLTSAGDVTWNRLTV